MKITLKWHGETGDGKRAYVVAEENNGYDDLRIEVDTDDCNREHAKKMMQEVIDRCNGVNTQDAAANIDNLRAALLTILDAVDYTTGNCRTNDMVSAVLDRVLITNARKVLSALPSTKVNHE